MQTRRRLAVAALVAAAASSTGQPRPAHACACCTEPGQRLELTQPLDAGVRDELARLRLAATASLYSDAGFPESVKGVAAPSGKAYRVALVASGGRLVFTLTDPARRSGRIGLVLPARLARFEIDPRTGNGKSPGGGPDLYKEWRIEGPASLDGIFAAGGRAATARLVLHGSGNTCTTASDFTHWTLSVRGPDARFTFLGRAVP